MGEAKAETAEKKDPHGEDAEAESKEAPAEETAEEAESDAAEEEAPLIFSDETQSRLFRTMLLLFVGSLLVLCGLTWANIHQRRQDLATAEQTVLRNANVSLEFFASRMQAWKQTALVGGRAAVDNDENPELQMSRVRAVLANLPGADELKVVYGRGSSQPVREIDLVQEDDKIESTYTDALRDYDWYKKGLNGDYWESPFVTEVHGRQHIAIAYVTPISATDGGPVIGVSRLVMPVNHLRNVLNAQSLGRVGFGMVIARDGRFVAHPLEAFMLQGKRVLEVAQEEGGAVGAVLRDASENAMKGQTGLLPRPDPISGQDCWLVYAPVPHSDWIAMYNVYMEEFLPLASVYRRHAIDISLWACITGFFLMLLIFKCYRGTNRRLWAGAVAFTLLCFCNMAYVWSSTLNRSGRIAAGGAIMSHATLHKLKATYDKAAQAEGVPTPVYIPTGIYIQAVTIGQNGNAVVSGYVWQKYKSTFPKDIEHGVIFPDDDKTTTLYEKTAAYVRKDGDVTTVGWSFRVDLRQNFSYEQYPFDRQDVAVRIWPIDFDKNVVLVPDLDAYEALAPLTRPGLDVHFSVSGFDALSTAFNFVDSTYTTNFGIASYMGQNAFPDLQYNIELRRQWLGPMLSNLFPLLMVLFTVYVNLMSFTKDDKPWGLYGTIAGLFFTSLLAHLKLRDVFSVHVINYLEYFYGVTYLMIVLVAANSYLVHATPEHPLLRFRKGLWNRLAFWPIVSTLLLLVTYWVFY